MAKVCFFIEIKIGAESVRMFSALYLNLPYDSLQDAFLPDSAVRVLREKPTLSQETPAYLEKYTVSFP